MLTSEELDRLSGAETLFPSPIPVQSVSSDEFVPAPQTAKQRAGGMAAAFMAFGFAAMGPAGGPVKRAILGQNNARLYGFSPKQQAGLQHDKLAHQKDLYQRHGAGRSNLAYGYISKG